MVEVKGPDPHRPGPGAARTLSIGELARRAGIATSALRFYEEHGLVHSERNAAGHRRYHADALRRVSFILVAQRIGLRLAEIRLALDGLPDQRTPTRDDWAELASGWRPVIEERIAILEAMRDKLDGCIGCGCLSLDSCAIYNPDDVAAVAGSGPRYLLGDAAPE